MIANEADQHFRMGIESVVPKNFDNLLHGCALDDNVAQGLAEREIEDSREAGIDAVELLSSTFKK